MRPEEDLLFSTARARMTIGNADRIREAAGKQVDWIRLIQLALQHETTALLCRNLQDVCPEAVPPDVLKPLAAHCEMQAAEARDRAGELVCILAALEDRGIFAITYKGPILAQRLYGDLSLRGFSEHSDLDIMIRECDLVRAQNVILNQGYRLAYRKQPVLAAEARECARTRRELHFRRERGGRRMLELQWRFMVRSARVQGDPERFFRRLETISLAGASVRSLPLEDYLLVLSLHATIHKWRKLKLICDIAEILLSPDVDWEYVLRVAGSLGLSRMVAIGVLLAEDPLEVVAPAGLTRRLKIDRTAHVLAIECRQSLLQEPDENWREAAEYKFLLRNRERPQDKARMFLGKHVLPRFTPDERDRRLVAIPESFAALYYFVRPVRMAWEKITGRP